MHRWGLDRQECEGIPPGFSERHQRGKRREQRKGRADHDGDNRLQQHDDPQQMAQGRRFDRQQAAGCQDYQGQHRQLDAQLPEPPEQLAAQSVQGRIHRRPPFLRSRARSSSSRIAASSWSVSDCPSSSWLTRASAEPEKNESITSPRDRLPMSSRVTTGR